MGVAKFLLILWMPSTSCSRQDPMEPALDSSASTGKRRSDSAVKDTKVPIQLSLEPKKEPIRSEKDTHEDTGKVLTGGDLSTSSVMYPETLFKGTGVAVCDEDVYLTTATVKSRLSETTFVMQLAAATVQTDSLEDKIQEEIDNNLTEVQYTLVPVADRGKIDGKDIAIFATSSLQVKQDIRFKFSEPLPVYVWPAVAARYDSLRNGGPKSWTAIVTGKVTFEATVTLTYVRGAGNRSTIRLETFIKEDQNGELYQDFPIPKIAEISVDGDRQIVERSKNENVFNGDRRCDDKLGVVKMDYEVCIRISPGKIEDFGCSL